MFLKNLSRAQSWFYEKVDSHIGEYAELIDAKQLKYVILYSLERSLAHLFPNHEMQFHNLTHLRRFADANPICFGLSMVVPVPKEDPAFQALSNFFNKIDVSKAKPPSTEQELDGTVDDDDDIDGKELQRARTVDMNAVEIVAVDLSVKNISKQRRKTKIESGDGPNSQ